MDHHRQIHWANGNLEFDHAQTPLNNKTYTSKNIKKYLHKCSPQEYVPNIIKCVNIFYFLFFLFYIFSNFDFNAYSLLLILFTTWHRNRIMKILKSVPHRLIEISPVLHRDHFHLRCPWLPWMQSQRLFLP